MKANLIIRASAGTGKTFSLATRFIRLMLFENVDPARIVALTFSRAAAQEIYVKLLERLWHAAASDEGAREEEALLKSGLSARDLAALEQGRVAFTPARFAEILRGVVESQEVGAIATLDSFILRIVRSFPLEMGFQHAVNVLDDFGVKTAVRTVGDTLLADDRAEDDELGAAFKAAQGGRFPRACQAAFGKILARWHEFLVDHPEAKNWTTDSMCVALGIPLSADRPDLAAACGSGKKNDPIDGAVAWISKFTGEGALFPTTKTGDLMRFLADHPDECVYAYATASGQEKRIDCGAAGAAAIRAGIRWMVATALHRQLEIVAAKLRLAAIFEGFYDGATRRRGQLTFADFTRCQAFAEGSANALKLQNLQYRFDERFSHWALDEFQDTSRLQWQCLRRLVREAAGGESRSVMIVGDLKQSIYGWRGGDDGPFREVMEDWGEFRGEAGESILNDVSYRYEQHTVNFINRVFGPENLRNAPLLDGLCARAVEAWLDASCWMTHKPDTDRAGKPKAGDYVEIVRVAKDKDSSEAAPNSDEDGEENASSAMRVLAPKICTLVEDLWHRHENLPDGKTSTDTIGILVRNNLDGAFLAERLRAHAGAEIPVVWEGASTILDAPAVQAVLELVRFAAHPEDDYAWGAIDRLLPLRKLVFPDLASRAEVASAVSRMLARLGLSRTLREMVVKLTQPAAGLSARSIACLEALVRLAVAFEQREEGSGDLAAFPQFLAASAGRESGDSPRVVRILTIHRAKGLTLDHVIVPILESDRSGCLGEPDPRGILEGEGWVLEMPRADLAHGNAALAAAWQAKADERLMELLRLNYVALTRARKSTYVFLLASGDKSGVQFRDILLAPFVGEGAQAPETRAYGEVVFSEGTPFAFGRREKPEASFAAWSHAAGLPGVARRTPSAAGSALAVTRGVKSLAAFFSKDFGCAAQHGIETHADYARIEWVDPAAPKDVRERAILASPDFRAAFVKPEPEATVWRERAYEIYDEATHVWESGQFDRVVFTGAGATRAAVIYDFKTNTPRPDESPADFAARLNALYAPQLEAYRHALNRLTAIPLTRITTHLLLAPRR